MFAPATHWWTGGAIWRIERGRGPVPARWSFPTAMPALYFTFIAVLLAGLGSRDQMTMAALSARRGRDPGLLLVAVLAAVLTAGFAAYAAQVILTELPAPARAIFAGIALGMAGLESLVLVPPAAILKSRRIRCSRPFWCC
ncbi:hypothetical protein ACFSTD_18655 [Novosphingobium colocasiae]